MSSAERQGPVAPRVRRDSLALVVQGVLQRENTETSGPVMMD